MSDAELREYARQMVAGWPPLTREQLEKIAVVFAHRRADRR